MSHQQNNQQRSSLRVSTATTALLAIATILVVVAHAPAAAQFMSHRLPDRNQERTAQKLVQHILELELPIQANNRQQQVAPRRASTHAVPSRDSRINMYRRDMGSTSATVDNLTSDRLAIDNSLPSDIDEGCDPSSSQFNGNLCRCALTGSGKVVCKRQQQQLLQRKLLAPLAAENPSESFNRNTEAVYTLLNNFEKLVNQLEARPAHLVRKNH